MPFLHAFILLKNQVRKRCMDKNMVTQYQKITRKMWMIQFAKHGTGDERRRERHLGRHLLVFSKFIHTLMVDCLLAASNKTNSKVLPARPCCGVCPRTVVMMFGNMKGCRVHTVSSVRVRKQHGPSLPVPTSSSFWIDNQRRVDSSTITIYP
jgi:hypothetical protein